ncbi:unnamed protein product, partial [Symbiodinium microadriaticum]
MNQADEFFSKVDKEDSIKELVDGVSEVLVIENKDFLVPTLSSETEELSPGNETSEEIDEEVEGELESSELRPDTQESQEEIEEIEEPEEEESEEDESYDSEEVSSDEETGSLSEENTEDNDGAEYTQEESTESDADIQQGGVLQSISESHQYMFIQELFAGDSNKFQDAIAHVEEHQSFDEAVEYLVQSYARELDWNMNSDEVKELLKVIFR